MPVIYMDKDSISALKEKDIQRIIEKNTRGMKYTKLQDYYVGNHAILQNVRSDGTLPNNRIVCNMAKYITDASTGYFVGKPVIYSSINKAFIEMLNDIFIYNDEQDHNMEIAKTASICGNCFEMLYLDENANIRMAKITPGELILICETGMTEPEAAIRIIIYKKREKQKRKVEYWTKNSVFYLQSQEDNKLELVSVEEHFWNDIPFVNYINNEEYLGDFEPVITQIDAYNRVQSNTANYFQYNDDAILKVIGFGDVDSKDVKRMREDGAVILDSGGDIDWLLKTIDDSALENYKNRLRQDIHLGANTPNMTDENFGNNMSGVAISYKLWGLDQKNAIKERKFKKGLQRRIELITTILNTQGHQFDYRDIDIQFRVNRPQNMTEIAEVVTKLTNDLSRESRLQLLPNVENVQDELDKLEAEQKKSVDDFGVYENLSKAFQTVEPESDA